MSTEKSSKWANKRQKNQARLESRVAITIGVKFVHSFPAIGFYCVSLFFSVNLSKNEANKQYQQRVDSSFFSTFSFPLCPCANKHNEKGVHLVVVVVAVVISPFISWELNFLCTKLNQIIRYIIFMSFTWAISLSVNWYAEPDCREYQIRV